MALTQEDLLAISSIVKSEVQPLKEDMQILKEDVQVLKEDVQVLKKDVQVLKEDVQVLKEDVQVLKENVQTLKVDMRKAQNDIGEIKLHIENVTDKNITLLAENYSNLVQKLDKNNMVTDLQMAYQIKVNYLVEDVAILKKEMRELKEQREKELVS